MSVFKLLAAGIVGAGLGVVATIQLVGGGAGRQGEARTEGGTRTARLGPTPSSLVGAAGAFEALEQQVRTLERQLDAARQRKEGLETAKPSQVAPSLAVLEERLMKLKRSPGVVLGVTGDLSDFANDFRSLGAEGLRRLLELAKSMDPADRILAFELLGKMDATAAIPALLEAAMHDKHHMSAVAASHALALMEDERARDALRDLAVQRPNPAAEINGLFGLAKHGDLEGIQLSIDYINNPKNDLAARAALGGNLMLLATESVMPAVDATVQQFSLEPQVTRFAAEYYRKLGTPTALARLTSLASNSNSCVPCRTVARSVLNEISPPG